MTLHADPAYPELDLDTIKTALRAAEVSRRQQLAALPTSPTDAVAVRHRGTVERLLAEIRAALARIESGTYGVCTTCRQPVPDARLELRPWAATCTRCGQL